MRFKICTLFVFAWALCGPMFGQANAKSAKSKGPSAVELLTRAQTQAANAFKEECTAQFDTLLNNPEVGKIGERRLERLSRCIFGRWEKINQAALPWSNSSNKSWMAVSLRLLSETAERDMEFLDNMEEDRRFIDAEQKIDLTAWRARFQKRMELLTAPASVADIASAILEFGSTELQAGCAERATEVKNASPGKRGELRLEGLWDCLQNLEDRLSDLSLLTGTISKDPGVPADLPATMKALYEEAGAERYPLQRFMFDGKNLNQRQIDTIKAWDAARIEKVKQMLNPSPPPEK